MDPIVFIDSLDNISIVNLNVPSLSPDFLPPEHSTTLLDDDLDDALSTPSSSPFHFADDDLRDALARTGGRRVTSSLDKVRTWKKYKNKKHLSQHELDRKRDLANKQERRRMHRLNDALNRLRAAIPSELQHPPPRRLSKIKTLQSAIRYIRRLQEVLETSQKQ